MRVAKRVKALEMRDLILDETQSSPTGFVGFSQPYTYAFGVTVDDVHHLNLMILLV
jgi:hypothetical protein